MELPCIVSRDLARHMADLDRLEREDAAIEREMDGLWGLSPEQATKGMECQQWEDLSRLLRQIVGAHGEPDDLDAAIDALWVSPFEQIQGRASIDQERQLIAAMEQIARFRLCADTWDPDPWFE